MTAHTTPAHILGRVRERCANIKTEGTVPSPATCLLVAVWLGEDRNALR